MAGPAVIERCPAEDLNFKRASYGRLLSLGLLTERSVSYRW